MLSQSCASFKIKYWCGEKKMLKIAVTDIVGCVYTLQYWHNQTQDIK